MRSNILLRYFGLINYEIIAKDKMDQSRIFDTLFSEIRTTTVRDITFVGTGTSSCIPQIDCLTQHPRSCPVCTSAYERPKASRNYRKNTSLLIRFNEPIHNETPKDHYRNILIDCGKTFYHSALEHLVPLECSRLDAVLLTHPHADAIFGLDDLRHWTTKRCLQKTVDVYCTEETMNVISTTFPYLANPSLATGGGQVASLRFHLIQYFQPFHIHNLEILPIPVHHGRNPDGSPFKFTAYKFDGITYMSDVSSVPEKSRQLIEKSHTVIMDALTENTSHPSHFSVEEALKELAMYRDLKQGILTGFGHSVDQENLESKLKDVKETYKDIRWPKEPEICPTMYAAFDGWQVSFKCDSIEK